MKRFLPLLGCMVCCLTIACPETQGVPQIPNSLRNARAYPAVSLITLYPGYPDDFDHVQTKLYPFTVPGEDGAREHWLLEDGYTGDTRTSSSLYREGKRHGLQRTWHGNGQLHTEKFYSSGVMDGTFREWTSSGLLVAQYRMEKGSGVKRRYGPEGTLAEESHYRDGALHGWRLYSSMPGQEYRISHYEYGNSTGAAYVFDEDGKLASIAWPNQVAVLLPGTRWHHLQEQHWVVSGRLLNARVYSEAAATDPALPPCHADVAQYSSYISEDVKARLKKFRAMPRVKIPLRLDGQGNPIPAP